MCRKANKKINHVVPPLSQALAVTAAGASDSRRRRCWGGSAWAMMKIPGSAAYCCMYSMYVFVNLQPLTRRRRRRPPTPDVVNIFFLFQQLSKIFNILRSLAQPKKRFSMGSTFFFHHLKIKHKRQKTAKKKRLISISIQHTCKTADANRRQFFCVDLQWLVWF